MDARFFIVTVGILSLVACGGAFSEESSAGDAGKKDGSAAAAGVASGGGSAGASSTGGTRASGGRAGAGGVLSSGGFPETGGSPASGGFPGSGGSDSSGGSKGTGGSPGSGGFPFTGGSPGTGGSSCTSTTCSTFSGLSCCGDSCVYLLNDPHNCGKCGNVCPNSAPYCSGGTCGTPPCTPPPGAGVCAPSSICCGTTCCAPGQICCAVTDNFVFIGCYDLSKSGGTCPVGCPACVCASPDTPIATPDGDRAIASLEVGDRVLSVDHGRVIDVPIARVHRTPVSNHHVVHVELSTGSILEISALHPTADGRTFGDLRDGELLGGVEIERVTVVPYAQAFTYDILPASDSGTYFAGGVLIGSTLGGDALSSRGADYSMMTSMPSR